MTFKYFLVLLNSCLLFSVQLSAQTIWGGPKIIFEKADYADWNLAESQDRITDSVWITRQDNQGIFNIRKEREFDRLIRNSPVGREWANGKISDGLENLTFTTWQETKQNQSALEVGRDKVMHLLREDIYIDIKFLQWTPGGGGSGTGFGGGFKYERSSPYPAGIDNLGKDFQLSVFQNQLVLTGNTTIGTVSLYSITGELIMEETVKGMVRNYSLNLNKLAPGFYIVGLNQMQYKKFYKP